MEGILGLLFIIGLFYIICKAFGTNRGNAENNTEPVSEPCRDQNITIDEISRQLTKTNDIMDQIKNVEEFITDMEVCELGIHRKVVTLSWISDSGKNLSFQFMVNGGDELNTELMLKLSYAERRQLRTMLKKELQKLGERGYANVTETIIKTDNRGVIYND